MTMACSLKVVLLPDEVLGIGTILGNIYKGGKEFCLTQRLNRLLLGLHTVELIIPSGPVTFVQFRFRNTLNISSALHKMLERSVGMSYFT